MKKITTKYITAAFVLFIGINFSISAQTVYITKSGEKFHTCTCRYLSKSKISISLSEAQEKGYTGCKVCKPSSITSTKKSSLNNQKKNVTPQPSATTVKQCSAIIESGTRCKRKTNHASGKCWQHQ